ncbi:DUF1109 domain-containing protein [Qipengyuania sp. SS22]|uniref:DUF1109 domain-containing protein n=1 Tax=Qipengyuania sp. SS22 TaxID=2979461 RepID=UPI0021E5403B|nr:DUF1109 domain-containing protein [Qipengyuania sp. SS22]UYH54845.1 DUF1109 domain-containing protein [Qipengyuania sp. SS22]
MNRVPHPLIDQLADDLAPVRPMKLWHGIALVGLAAIVTIGLVEMFDGLWRGIVSGRASAFFFIANGMLGLLGAASALTVIRMAGPRVGNRHDGARWALAMFTVLPLAALVVLGLQGNLEEVTHDPYGLDCFLAASGFAVLTFAALVVWLRRGAPVAPATAGTFAGIAAGAIGSFAYGLACPLDTLAHLGTWHALPVVLGAAGGRVTVPPLVRW